MSSNTEPRRWDISHDGHYDVAMGPALSYEPVEVVEAFAYDALAAENATLRDDHETLRAECEWRTLRMHEGDQERRALAAENERLRADLATAVESATFAIDLADKYVDAAEAAHMENAALREAARAICNRVEAEVRAGHPSSTRVKRLVADLRVALSDSKRGAER